MSSKRVNYRYLKGIRVYDNIGCQPSSIPTLQEVCDAGNKTTTKIQVGDINGLKTTRQTNLDLGFIILGNAHTIGGDPVDEVQLSTEGLIWGTDQQTDASGHIDFINSIIGNKSAETKKSFIDLKNEKIVGFNLYKQAEWIDWTESNSVTIHFVDKTTYTFALETTSLAQLIQSFDNAQNIVSTIIRFENDNIGLSITIPLNVNKDWGGDLQDFIDNLTFPFKAGCSGGIKQ